MQMKENEEKRKIITKALTLLLSPSTTLGYIISDLYICNDYTALTNHSGFFSSISELRAKTKESRSRRLGEKTESNFCWF